MARGAKCLVVVLLVIVSRDAAGFIQRIYSLQEVLNESTSVLTGRIESVDAAARTATLTVQRAVKGKQEFKRVLMNIAVGPGHHAQFIMDRLKPGAEAIVFYKREGNSLASVVHAGDIWFQLFASDDPKNRDKVWWRMSHVEIYLGRTYNGSTPDLIKLLDDVVAGRAKPPKPVPTVPALDVDRVAQRVAVAPAKGKGAGFHRQTQFRHAGGGEIRGIACADVNGDELIDVLLCRAAGNLLLANQPAGFQDATAQMGLTGGSRAALWADYDGDDHPDLLTSNFQLFTSSGGKLRDDSKLLNPPAQRNPEGSGWIDYNADGRPDILIANGEHGILLYENTGKGPQWFRDVSDKAGLGPKGLGAGNGDFIVFLDYDADGYMDFFYNLGDGVLAHNEGNGTFKLDRKSGLKLASPNYKRGVAVADFDNDGDIDLFIPGPGKPQLYRNNNDGTFTDVIDASGDLASVKTASFAAAWGDVNSDGALDLFVCHPGGPARLYLGDGKGGFTDFSKQSGADALAGAHAASFADVDKDGDLDLVVNLSDRVVVALNDIPRPQGFGSLVVRVNARRGLAGATVRLSDDRARRLGLRVLGGADGPGGQTSPVGHFGLRAANCRVSVCLSDGRVAQKAVALEAKPNGLAFTDEDFK